MKKIYSQYGVDISSLLYRILSLLLFYFPALVDNSAALKKITEWLTVGPPIHLCQQRRKALE